MWNNWSVSERHPQLEYFPAKACTISKISHKQHTYIVLSKGCHINENKNPKKKSMVIRQLDLHCVEPRLVAVNSWQWNKILSKCCTWSSLKESAEEIIYIIKPNPLQYPSVYISQLFFLHQHKRVFRKHSYTASKRKWEFHQVSITSGIRMS